MKYVIYALLLLLIVLHQDFWNWHRHEPLIFGFIPVGLAHHVGISLAAAVVAGLTVKYCWPSHLDAAESAHASSSAERKGHA